MDELGPHPAVVPLAPRFGMPGLMLASRLLVVATPGGLAGFFDELAAGHAAGRPDAEVRAALAGRYDALLPRHPDERCRGPDRRLGEGSGPPARPVALAREAPPGERAVQGRGADYGRSLCGSLGRGCPSPDGGT